MPPPSPIRIRLVDHQALLRGGCGPGGRGVRDPRSPLPVRLSPRASSHFEQFSRQTPHPYGRYICADHAMLGDVIWTVDPRPSRPRMPQPRGAKPVHSPPITRARSRIGDLDSSAGRFVPREPNIRANIN
jgi:hypothetical protein